MFQTHIHTHTHIHTTLNWCRNLPSVDKVHEVWRPQMSRCERSVDSCDVTADYGLNNTNEFQPSVKTEAYHAIRLLPE
jgi:hypothetical protein